MAWSTPRTWGVGEALTSANMNTFLSNELSALAAYGTAFPGSPVDGTPFVLVDSTTTPTYSWRFIYSTSAVGWLFVGGAPKVVAAGSTTLPTHNGDYYIEGKGNFGGGGTTSGGDLTGTLTVNGVTKDSTIQNGPSTAASGSGTRGRAAVSLMTYATGTTGGQAVAVNMDENPVIAITPVKLTT